MKYTGKYLTSSMPTRLTTFPMLPERCGHNDRMTPTVPPYKTEARIKQGCHADVFGRTNRRTDDRTMAAGASVTCTHCSVLFEVTWAKTAASARTHQRPRRRAASRPWMPRDYIRGPQTFHSHFLRRLGLEKLRCVWCTSWSGL
jgi:hypothetical protein